jgi:hypothetical protein
MEPYDTICPNCSHQWTLNPLVSRSWGCPQCGTHRTAETTAWLCTCGHDYERHENHRRVENSIHAFSFPGTVDEAEIEALPDDVEHPAIGRCLACVCSSYARAA